MTAACFIGDSLLSPELITAMSTRLGWTIAAYSGVGGSGFIKPGSGTNFLPRLPALLAYNPDVFVVIGGCNDGAPDSEATIRAAEDTFFVALRAGLPNVKLYVAGVWNLTQIRFDNLRAATLAVGGQFIDWGDCADVGYDFQRSGGIRWMTGTGDETHLNGDGNRDVYMQSLPHPTIPAGRNYVGTRFAFAIRPPSTGLVGW